jgi:hypothetical protein
LAWAAALVALVVAASTVALAARRNAPTAVAGLGVASDQFSAKRAAETIDRVIGAAPHPTGSVALDGVRARAVDALRAAGLLPVVTESMVCAPSGACARVHQVVARLDGASREAVMIAAHLDSVGASPGAGDDGQGVAIVLELARALRLRPRDGRSFVFVLDEGEELGLLGMRGFMRDHPWARDVRAAVNVEARGDEGLPVLFEVGGDGSAMRVLAPTLPPVFTSSLAAAIYARMPNDTDFSVVRDVGIPGANLAFVGGVTRYHTGIDDRAHLSLASVQLQGQAALAAAQALAGADLTPRGPTAWIDAQPLGVWPYGKTGALLVSGLALLVAGVAADVERRRGGRFVGPVVVGASSVLVLPLLAGLIGQGARRALVIVDALPAPFVAHHGALILVGVVAALLAAALLLRLGARWLDDAADGRRMLLGVTATMSLMALVVSAFALPFSPALLPAALLGALASGLLVGGEGRAFPLLAAPVATFGFAFSIAMPLVLALDIAGHAGVGGVAALSGFALLAVAPWWVGLGARRSRDLACLALALLLVGSTAFAATRRPFEVDAPQRVNVTVAARSGAPTRAWVSAAWGARAWGAPPTAMLSALDGLGAGAHRTEPPTPWSWLAAPYVELPSLTLPSPTIEDVARVAGEVRFHARSPRLATKLVLAARSPNAGRWMVFGQPASPRQCSESWYCVAALGVPQDGVDLAVPEAAEIWIGDVAPYDKSTPAHIEAFDRLVAARPADAQPTQDGDEVASFAPVR